MGDIVSAFRGRRQGSETDASFVARHWDLDALATQYRRFIRRYEPIASVAASLEPEQAFVLRFAMVFENLETSWSDPYLPDQLLPADWPGRAARQLSRHLYESLLPLAVKRADQLMARST